MCKVSEGSVHGVDLPSARRLHRLPQRLDYNLIPAPLGKT